MSASACSAQMYKERREVLWIGTSFIPVIGDIQTIAQAQSAADVIWGIAGFVPDLERHVMLIKLLRKLVT